MSEDYGTVNVRRGERSREIELLRQHYGEHREALVRMAAEAPTSHLAGEYHRLIRDIDAALAKVDEIEGPGTRPLVTPAQPVEAPAPPPSNGRLILIVVAGAIVLAIIGYLIYRASGDRGAKTTTATITEGTTPVTTTTAPVTIEPVTPAPVAGGLTVSPVVADYGTIRKGTRATRQIEVTNAGAAPLSYKVARSQCKCLFYEYKDTIAPKGKETITVTVDGARAKAGTLQETIDVTSKKDPTVTASFQVSATIK